VRRGDRRRRASGRVTAGPEVLKAFCYEEHSAVAEMLARNIIT